MNSAWDTKQVRFSMTGPDCPWQDIDTAELWTVLNYERESECHNKIVYHCTFSSDKHFKQALL